MIHSTLLLNKFASALNDVVPGIVDKGAFIGAKKEIAIEWNGAIASVEIGKLVVYIYLLSHNEGWFWRPGWKIPQDFIDYLNEAYNFMGE